MKRRFVHCALRHRNAISLALLVALVLNLTVIGRLTPADSADLDSGLPVAARCQGGGPGCVEQPLIPPPVGGLPALDGPAAPVFGALVLVTSAAPAAVIESTPDPIEHPPALRAA